MLGRFAVAVRARRRAVLLAAVLFALLLDLGARIRCMRESAPSEAQNGVDAPRAPASGWCSPEGNETFARVFYRLYNDGRLGELLRLLHRNVDWQDAYHPAQPGQYYVGRGKAAVETHLRSRFADGDRLEIQRVIPGTHVITVELKRSSNTFEKMGHKAVYGGNKLVIDCRRGLVERFVLGAAPTHRPVLPERP